MKGLSDEMLKEARQYFIEGKYKLAEPILEQLLFSKEICPTVKTVIFKIEIELRQKFDLNMTALFQSNLKQLLFEETDSKVFCFLL